MFQNPVIRQDHNFETSSRLWENPGKKARIKHETKGGFFNHP
jgi:hypothetical protein